MLGRKLTGHTEDANSRDLQRNINQRAIIGDPRNDENVIVSQLQATFIRFHNRVANVLKKKDPSVTFEQVQQCVRWHYQWVVLYDFLPTIVGQKMLETVLPHIKLNRSVYEERPKLEFYKFKKSAFMPVEFSVAAYRFGHSMIRPIYRLNQTLPDRQFIFGGANDFQNLVGFREFPNTWAIDWDLFFNPGNAPLTGKNRIQKAYKIDSSIVNPLGSLPPAVAKNPPSLAERNLLRGMRMGLPSGQAVAKQMNIKPLTDKQLKVGKATEEDAPGNKSITEISKAFAGNAPLWYYVLAEAQQQFKKDGTPIHLGPVGGRIVTEVFVGLLWGDNHSFLAQDPFWEPLPEFMVDGKFKIKDLIKQALKDADPA
ncbi:MAG: peroxidase family protein [Chitinophagaceae bacterium]